MKPDLYTRIVLTVIALCLVVLAVDRLWRPAEAQSSSTDVNLASIAGLPLKIAGPDPDPPNKLGQVIVVFGPGTGFPNQVPLQVQSASGS